MDSKKLKLFLQAVYCRIDFYTFAEFLNVPIDDKTMSNQWLRGHWERFQNNLAGWYCELTDSECEKFVELVESKRKR